jgi:hypothetical protein
MTAATAPIVAMAFHALWFCMLLVLGVVAGPFSKDWPKGSRNDFIFMSSAVIGAVILSWYLP